MKDFTFKKSKPPLGTVVYCPVKKINRTVYWQVETDITIKPITLVIDTGSQITIICDDRIKPDMTIRSSNATVTGIAGDDHPVKTTGIVTTKFIMGNTHTEIDC